MSWLYSIFFAGLIFSASGEAVKQGGPATRAEAVHAVTAQGDEQERFEQSYPFTANGRVNVSNINGSITVEAWDKNEVRLEAVKTADTKEALAEVQLKIDARPDSFSVETDYDDWRRRQNGWKNHGKLQVQFRLSVPRGAVLDDIETVNGSVTVSNFTNLTKVSAVNGNVIASNLRGTANLSTVNGEVAADFERLETGTRISLSTVNGRVNLTLPSDVNATIKADSLNGDIRNDFGLPVRKGQYVGRDLYGRIGSGDVHVRLESVNGPLTVQRRNDGKAPNPATDLLKQKGNDDDRDWDIDSSRRFNTDKINKEIAKATRDSAKAAQAGIEVAIPELAKIPAEIEKIRVESFENLKANDEKFKINEAEIKRKVDEGLRRQQEALSNMRRIRWTGRNPQMVKKVNSFPVKGVPKVTVDAKGCSVTIRAWDKNEVKYVLTEMADRRQPPVTVAETATPTSVTLKVLNNDDASRDMYFDGDAESVRIDVFVPRKADLKVVSNGEIRLDGVSGEIELNGVDEAIDVRNAEGKLTVAAADAQVRIIGFTGELDSKVADADVYLEGNFSRITGRAGNGRFILTVPEAFNADVTSNLEALTVEDMAAPKEVKEGQWRFGSGGPKLNLSLDDGEIRFRNADTLSK